MKLLLASAICAVGRAWSIDLRTGRSGGGTLCNCTLFLKSKLSFSLRTGSVGRTSGMSLGDGSGCFECWPVGFQESVTCSFSATAWCIGGGGK
jgi:hypothetical protein